MLKSRKKFLNNPWVKEEFITAIRKIFRITHNILCIKTDGVQPKDVHREVLAINLYFRKL